MKLFDPKPYMLSLETQIHKCATSKTTLLGIIQIGNDSASTKYVSLKKKLSDKLGLGCNVYQLDAALSDTDLSNQVTTILTDPKVGGCIIQLPLPRASLNFLLNLIPLEKDIDCISPQSAINMSSGDFLKLSPVVRAFDLFVKHCTNGKIPLSEEKIVVVGNGDLVGKPISSFATQNGMEVFVIDNYRRGDSLVGDYIVLSAGIPNLVSASDISVGANVVDFGSSIVDGKTVGDLDMTTDCTHLSWLSTSPGGMGPLVVRFLLMNFLGL